jgi:hypothetical protein
MRNRLLLLLVRNALVVLLLAMPTATLAQEEPADEGFLPVLLDATFGQNVMATNLRESTLFTEPMLMWVIVIGFSSESDAAQGYTTTIEQLETYATSPTDREYRQVSIGQTGDESIGLYSDGGTESPHSLQSVVRTGPNLMVVWSISLADGLPEYMADYLQGLIAESSDDPASLLPTLRTLPPGWELLNEEPTNVLPQLHAPDATPRA